MYDIHMINPMSLQTITAEAGPIYSTASAEPSFEHPSPRFTLTCSLKMTTAIGVFRVVTGVQLPTAVNSARRGVRTPRVPMAGHGGPWW